ncbi:hypothetical protein BH10ACT11_BH10ACT11_16280 [soil metagenome]
MRGRCSHSVGNRPVRSETEHEVELILAILAAGPIGYFAATRKSGLAIYLIAWAIVFPIQTIVSGQAGDWTYYPVNLAILILGLGLNRFGSIRGERRRSDAEGVSAARA